MNKIKKNRIKKMKGGAGILTSVNDLINSTLSLGKSIFNEINQITQIKYELSHGVIEEPGTPNVMNGPPPFYSTL
jgi:hypothetical protein